MTTPVLHPYYLLDLPQRTGKYPWQDILKPPLPKPVPTDMVLQCLDQRWKQVIIGLLTRGCHNFVKAWRKRYGEFSTIDPDDSRLLPFAPFVPNRPPNPKWKLLPCYPRPPDVYTECSKRVFDKKLRNWRTKLHEFDDFSEGEADEGDLQAPPGDPAPEGSHSPGHREEPSRREDDFERSPQIGNGGLPSPRHPEHSAQQRSDRWRACPPPGDYYVAGGGESEALPRPPFFETAAGPGNAPPREPRAASTEATTPPDQGQTAAHSLPQSMYYYADGSSGPNAANLGGPSEEPSEGEKDSRFGTPIIPQEAAAFAAPQHPPQGFSGQPPQAFSYPGPWAPPPPGVHPAHCYRQPAPVGYRPRYHVGKLSFDPAFLERHAFVKEAESSSWLAAAEETSLNNNACPDRGGLPSHSPFAAVN
ncbi:hypothetical protein DIPPA_21687 [Diplonema papillatum]|nr:hypothetical protein DIPPA_21687 [Diplonema papillatum]